MILAAGRGERMRPLTDHTPKPLLRAGGHALIEWHLRKLATAGIVEVVINHAWLGNQIETYLGDGARYGLSIRYSPETTALETAGGIKNALPLLGDDPFLVLNGDVYSDWLPSSIQEIAKRYSFTERLAHLVLVPNPAHHPDGDFYVDQDANALIPQAVGLSNTRFTYSGIGYYHPHFFESVAPQTPARLAPLLHERILTGHVGAEVYSGFWTDVGTPERLHELRLHLGENV